MTKMTETIITDKPSTRSSMAGEKPSMTGAKLTRQIIGLVTFCLILAEIVIFVPSASQFQYRWFENQWQHFLVQFDKERESDLAALATSYEARESNSAIRFHPPQFICWKDKTGADVTLGHKGEDVPVFNLGDSPMRQIGLVFAIITGVGPHHVLVYDDRSNDDFRATWSTALIRDELQDYAVRILTLTLIIGLIIIAPLYWFLSTRFVRPLRTIKDHIGRFTSDPSLLLEPINTNNAADEITEIAQALTILTEDIRRALRQKERLADIGEATAKINHDLRNILVSATLVTDILHASQDPKIKRIAPHIERAISDAAGMTQNMMDYLTEAKPELAIPFHLPEMATNLTYDTTLAVTVTGTQTLVGMPNTLYRLLLNLARNAKSAGASSLAIDVWRAGHLAVIDISDDGPGIDKGLKSHLFSAFHSGHKSNTGLGLAIAKDLSLVMGGELRLSRSSAHGSEFRLSVPKSWLSD